MEVFVLTKAYDCEGESFIDVFASLEGAKVFADKDAATYRHSDGEWRQLSPKDHERPAGSSSQYRIVKATVQP